MSHKIRWREKVRIKHTKCKSHPWSKRGYI